MFALRFEAVGKSLPGADGGAGAGSSGRGHGAANFDSIWHNQDIQGQIPALAFWSKSLKRFKFARERSVTLFLGQMGVRRLGQGGEAMARHAAMLADSIAAKVAPFSQDIDI